MAYYNMFLTMRYPILGRKMNLQVQKIQAEYEMKKA